MRAARGGPRREVSACLVVLLACIGTRDGNLSAQPATDIRLLNDRIQQESTFVEALLAQAGQVIVGQRQMIERLLIGLITGGHVLLEGVPGLAKTLTVKTLSECLQLSFKRIQFTPDLLPADLIGTQIYQPQTQSFTVKKGPLFANLILADEINRAPAKVQSALLESMQEKQVPSAIKPSRCPRPFWCWRRRTRSSRRARTRSPRRRSIASCSR
jgi:MoxR-like ATPase